MLFLPVPVDQQRLLAAAAYLDIVNHTSNSLLEVMNDISSNIMAKDVDQYELSRTSQLSCLSTYVS